jgi:hypothetical protein
VPDSTIAQCKRAVELTERSLIGPVPEGELRAIDFAAISDAGDDAFVAAAHVGWNLLAPLNGLDPIDEFEAAQQTAHLAGCAGGPSEMSRQLASLRRIVAEVGGE